jgi:pimeloyl-ACP methyl ester carboxylesterase
MESPTTRQGNIEISGVRIDYTEAGSGEAVVLLDGWRGGLSTLQTELAQNYRTISFQLNNANPVREHATILANAVRGLIDGNYTLIGSSRGADMAAWIAIEAGDSLDALVLLSPMGIRPRMQDASPDDELESRLVDVPCPTLVVFGTDDRLVSREAARVYAESIPSVNLSLVYDAGHLITADRPDALSRLVADYVERRDTFVVGRGGSTNTL